MGVDGWMDEGRKKDPVLLIEEIRQLGKHENRWVPVLMLDYQETAKERHIETKRWTRKR